MTDLRDPPIETLPPLPPTPIATEPPGPPPPDPIDLAARAVLLVARDGSLAGTTVGGTGRMDPPALASFVRQQRDEIAGLLGRTGDVPDGDRQRMAAIVGRVAARILELIGEGA